jgi:hypothetical protein
VSQQTIDLDSIVAQLEGLAQQVRQIAAAPVPVPPPSAQDLAETARLNRLEDKLNALLSSPTVENKRQRRSSPPVRRDEMDENGVHGVSLLWWVDNHLENCSLYRLKTSLTRVGYFQRMVHRNRMVYRVTPLGRQFFFERPYITCPGFPETFVNAAGQEELKRLYTAAKLILRNFV